MSKPIVLSEAQWARLHTQLAKDNPVSVMLIQDKMKSVLGFKVRRHQEWVSSTPNPMSKSSSYSGKQLIESIRLDFYNEPKRTMFLLKYSEYLDKSGNTNLDIE
jgi:hypothetical protein